MHLTRTIWMLLTMGCNNMEIKNLGGVFVAYNSAGIEVARSKSKYYLKQKIDGYVDEPAVDNKAVEFPINQRFEFVGKIVDMIAKRITPSVVITGEGGLGKTHTVIDSLERAGLRNVTDLIADVDIGSVETDETMFVVIKGYSTPKGLFKLLYEHRNATVVFDDCDSILKDPDALNLLKGALDSYDKRYITWNTSFSDDNIPSMFQFTGGVIFVSNLTQDKINQAIRSRSMCVDLSMTVDQKIDRMEFIVNRDNFLPNVPSVMKFEAFEFLKTNRNEAREINLRTLINVAKIRQAGDKDWEQLAKYMLVN
jgi:hypothetical protein